MEWMPPPVGKRKINFNGSSRENLDPAAFGCIVRAELGQIVMVVSGLLGFCNATKVELMGLLVGL